MNITPVTRQVTEYSLVLDSDDLARYLNDPAAFVADVRAQLNGSAPAVPGKPARRHPARRKAAARRKAPKARKAASGGLERVRCPDCQQEIAAKYLPNHLAKKHAKTSTESKADWQSTPPPSADAAA
jgi:hypothetical protein